MAWLEVERKKYVGFNQHEDGPLTIRREEEDSNQVVACVGLICCIYCVFGFLGNGNFG